MIRHWQFINLPSLKVNGIALFPFVLVKDKRLLKSKTFINHEHIHLRQQIELLVIPFYLFYLLNYFINRIYYKSHYTAYLNICFEREAHNNEGDLNYLKKRRFWEWLKYVK
jgi:hypothetical protein